MRISKTLIQTILKQKIGLHDIRKISAKKISNTNKEKIYSLNITYNKVFLTTRYNMQCDGSFIPQKEFETNITDLDITYDTETQIADDLQFLYQWDVLIESNIYFDKTQDKYDEDHNLIRLIG